MELQTLALVIIGIILLFIIGAFVFSSSFRKDVTAAEGEASVLGMFSVKGVLIILLCAIFCGTFIVIFQSDKKNSSTRVDVSQTSNNLDKTRPSVDLKKPSGHIYNVLVDSFVSHEITPVITSIITKDIINFGTKTVVDGMPNFYFRIDSVEYDNNIKSRYNYFVNFAEANESDTIWLNTPRLVEKSANGEFDTNSKIMDINNEAWSSRYKVLMLLGHPSGYDIKEKAYKRIEMATLIFVSARVDVRKQ